MSSEITRRFWEEVTVRTYGTKTPSLWQIIKRWFYCKPGEL